MSRNHTFYFPIEPKPLEKLVAEFQERFDEFLLDSFSDEELLQYESMTDAMAVFFVQPILSELTIHDFYPDPTQEAAQVNFFETCKSSISVENIPYFESNPFQVTYLSDFLDSMGEVLIDRGGIEVLQFKQTYKELLQEFKNLDSLLRKKPIVKKSLSPFPVHPMDFIVKDTYTELALINAQGKIPFVMEEIKTLPPGMKKVIDIMLSGTFDAESLMLKSTLGPKAFGDDLERLKFFLRRMNKQ